MHELGIVFHILRTVNEAAEENELKEVSSVTLELGEVSGVVAELLTDCWRWAVQKEEGAAHAAALQIEPIEAVTLCNDCQKTYATVQYGRICPYCGSENTFLQTGNEIMVKEIIGQ